MPPGCWALVPAMQARCEMIKRVGSRAGLALSDDDADWILWEETAFPFASRQRVLAQARRYVRSMIK